MDKSVIKGDIFKTAGRAVYYIALSIAALVSGCAGNTARQPRDPSTVPNHIISRASKGSELTAINSLLVAPIAMESQAAANLPPGLDPDQMLSQALTEELQIKIVHSTRGLKQKEHSAIAANQAENDYLEDARKMKLDGVLLTRINNLDTRLGSAVGSSSPARVDLSMEILAVNAKERSVWRSSYHFKDAALSDNLFKIGQNSGKFRSAEEILAEGLKNSIRDFSQKRLAGFIR